METELLECTGCFLELPLSEFVQKKSKNISFWCISCRKKENDYKRFQAFGITAEQFELMKLKQNNECPICKKEFTDTPAVDHDHNCCPGRKTCGKCIRGLLCSNCNRQLGIIEKQNWLNNAIAYLDNYHR